VGVAFLRKNSAESDDPLQPHTRDHDLQNMNGIPRVDYVDIRGPFEASGPGDTPSRSRIFVCLPSSARERRARAREEVACATKILSTLARRAYRRPVTDDEGEDAGRRPEWYREITYPRRWQRKKHANVTVQGEFAYGSAPGTDHETGRMPHTN
jgi:hypothetical protein